LRKPEDYSKWALAILGWIGMACTLAIGAYIVTFCWIFQSIGFLLAAIIVWVLTVVSAFFLGYGSLKVAKGFMLMGGALNSIAGCATFAVFYYFYYYLPFLYIALSWKFGLFSFLFFAPALVSGLLSLAWHQKTLFKRNAVKKARHIRKPYPARERKKHMPSA
jgi:hypothetical protein